MTTTASPFFIIGAGRSGTTLLRLMLCGSKDLFIPPEAWFFGELLCAIPSDRPLDRNQLELFESICLANDRWKDWNCTTERLRAILEHCVGKDLAFALDQLFRGAFNLSPEVRWGEKSPRHSHIVARMAEVFPQSQFVHLIRDGRDVTASMVARGWYDASTRRVAEHWQTCVEASSRAASLGSNRYMEVRFEKLLADPEVEVRRICAFLHVDFSPRMLSYQEQVEMFIPSGEAGFHGKLTGGLSTREVGKWKSSLSAWQEAVFWTVSKRPMQHYYASEKPRRLADLILPLASVGVCLDRLRCTLLAKL